MFELTDQQRLIQESARTMAEKNFKQRAAHADRAHEPPVDNLRVLRENGFTGIFLPEAYGGAGLGLLDMVLIVEQIARYCANTAMLVGCADGASQRTILQVGTEAQKQRYLPRVARGELYAAWSMSEADAGSDVGNVRTRAVRSGDHYVINGEKLWCSCAQIAHIFLVLVRFTDEPGMRGVGGILIERDTPGMTVGKHLDLIGLRATGMAPLLFENCRVPAENVVVQPGEMRKLLRVLDADRIGGNPPICLGVAIAAFEGAVAYVKERKQFGKPLAEQQGLQWKLADMAIDIEAARALLYRTAARVDAGTAQIHDASIAKTFVNEMAIRVTSTAMHLCGAFGLSTEYPFERYFRDVRGMSIGYGTTEIHRNTIAREIIDGRYSV